MTDFSVTVRYQSHTRMEKMLKTTVAFIQQSTAWIYIHEHTGRKLSALVMGILHYYKELI
jgi:hypothetical protein